MTSHPARSISIDSTFKRTIRMLSFFTCTVGIPSVMHWNELAQFKRNLKGPGNTCWLFWMFSNREVRLQPLGSFILHYYSYHENEQLRLLRHKAMMTRVTCLKLSNHWRLTTKPASWRLSGLCVFGIIGKYGKGDSPHPLPPPLPLFLFLKLDSKISMMQHIPEFINN